MSRVKWVHSYWNYLLSLITLGSVYCVGSVLLNCLFKCKFHATIALELYYLITYTISNCVPWPWYPMSPAIAHDYGWHCIWIISVLYNWLVVNTWIIDTVYNSVLISTKNVSGIMIYFWCSLFSNTLDFINFEIEIDRHHVILKLCVGWYCCCQNTNCSNLMVFLKKSIMKKDHWKWHSYWC